MSSTNSYARRPLQAAEHSLVVGVEGEEQAEVTVCISLYNYADYIVQALDSVFQQDINPLDLIVVEDVSSDRSLEVAREWIELHQTRFNNVKLVQHQANSGLAAARNTAVSLCVTSWVFILDADNEIYPRCVSRCLQAAQVSNSEFAYPMLEVFGGRQALMGYQLWDPDRLALGNYIDALGLISKEALEAANGYSQMKVTGWEDYELWCTFVELGFAGVQVPEILARYREHSASMLRTITNQRDKAPTVVAEMRARHPWLLIGLGA